MALPLIAGIGSKLLSSGKTEDKNITASKKKIKAEKFFDKEDRGGALVKTSDTKVKLKPSSALVKYQPPEKSKDKISDLSSEEKKKSTGEELQSIIDEVKKLKSGLVRVRGLLAERKNSDLKSLVESKKSLEIEKKKRREGELEKKKPEKGKDGISLPKPKFSFFDSIINFFTSILVGSLLNFLLANKNTIFKAFDDITKGFNNIFDVMRYSIISLTTTMPKLIKSLANFGKQVFRGPAKLTGNLLKKLGSSIKNLLVRTGKALGNFVSGTFKNLRGLAGGAGSGSTRATGVQQRRLTGAAAKSGAGQQLRPLPKPGTPKPTSAATLKNAESLFKPGGLKHFKKVSGIFKKVPFIGALIGIGIDLAMGERLDNAIAGAAGASLGAAIGGAIGTAVLPIPFVGTFLGGTIGAAIGDWAGKEIYKNLSGQINQINPPLSELSTTPSGYSPSLASALNQPLPGVSGTGFGIASGPGAEGLASFVAKAETGGRFNAYNGDWRDGKRGDNNILSLKLTELRSYMDKNHPNSSGAVGAYQFMPETAISLASQLRMDPSKTPFTPEVQKQLHLRHLKSLGYDDFASGKMSRQQFGMNIAQQYRALPDPRTGYTWSDNASSRNRATVSLQAYLNALDKSKQQGSSATPPPAPILPGPDGRMPVQGRPSTPLVGGGQATFGSTGRVSNAPNWVHGHFQDNNRTALLNNTFPIVKTLLAQGVPVVITGGPGEEQLSRNMSDSRIREAISRGIDRHSNRTRGYFAVDVSVPEGTKVPVPLQDIRSGGNEGISGLIPGTNTFIGHLAPGSRSATASELAQALRQQASYDQRGGTIVVPAPVIGGGGGQMVSGGGGGVLPVGMLQKDVLNSYYRAQLMGFLYKQG